MFHGKHGAREMYQVSQENSSVSTPFLRKGGRGDRKMKKSCYASRQKGRLLGE